MLSAASEFIEEADDEGRIIFLYGRIRRDVFEVIDEFHLPIIGQITH
jgi:hypothetical protein